MADAGDFYGGLVPLIEENPVVATAETKAGFRRLEFFQIATALGQVTVKAMQNLNCGGPIDGPQIGSGFGGPFDRKYARGQAPRSPLQPEFAEDFLVRDALSAS